MNIADVTMGVNQTVAYKYPPRKQANLERETRLELATSTLAR